MATMSEYIKSKKDKISYVSTDKVSCEGPKVSKHPRVYLTVKGGEINEVVCPYCAHTFRKEVKPKKG
ncbi:MAG: putative Zn-finger protein [Alphaproteobacteria bacterium]|jgi:uncharacterized Zn-finger protein